MSTYGYDSPRRRGARSRRAVRREMRAILLRRSELKLWQKALAEVVIFALIAVLGLVLFQVTQAVRHPIFQLHDPGTTQIHYRTG